MSESQGIISPPANRLAHETSPYLLQHAHNPVDWYPWGAEALERSVREEIPIFLSIGYSACHWCHVMERESFENPQIAQLLNTHFVCIKVDREERPDLDEIYMSAVVAMAGSGGWPMSVFLTPQLVPFYGGTYYPPVDMYGRPGFPTIVRAVSNAWENRREEVLQSAQSIRDQLESQLAKAPAAPAALTEALLANAATQLRHSFDGTFGGWGGAPKFPSSGSIQLLLRQNLREAKPELLHMASLTLDSMANGGMYDHLGGGFHRYSVDERWLVPHFEKMLYDNAQLAQVYLEAWLVTKKPHYRKVVEETLDYVLRDMQDPAGPFYSTEDADSEGQEGRFYVWTESDVRDRLSGQQAPLFCTYYNVRPEGNFNSHESYHHGQNILHVTRPLGEVAAEFGIEEQEAWALLHDARRTLLEARGRRVRPGRDDKILSAWNGLIITAFAQAGRAFGEPRYREAAERAARFFIEDMYRDGQLLRTARNGVSRLPGYLDDYAFLANAFFDLYEATFVLRWMEAAQEICARMREHFWDEQQKTFYFTSAHHTDVLLRTRPTYDGAEPSGNSIAALVMLRIARVTGDSTLLNSALAALESNQGMMQRAPQGYLKMLCAVDFVLGPGKEIAIVSPGTLSLEDPMVRAAHEQFLPRSVVAAASAREAEETATRIPLLAGRPPQEERTTAYVCHNFTCELPVTEPDALAEKLN